MLSHRAHHLGLAGATPIRASLASAQSTRFRTTTWEGLTMVPDLTARFEHELAWVAHRIILADLKTMDDGPWACCPRTVLRHALERLHDVSGLSLMVAFEHEFQFVERHEGQLRLLCQIVWSHLGFAESLMGSLAAANLRPKEIMSEFAPDQFEIVLAPTGGLAAADAAVALREITHTVALHFGHEVTFSPMRASSDEVGNGLHIHLSLWSGDGMPQTLGTSGPLGLAH